MRLGLYRLNSTILSCRLKALNASQVVDLQVNCFTHEVRRQKNSLSPKVLWVRGRKYPVSGRTKNLATTIDSQFDVNSQIRRYLTRQRLMHKTRNLELDPSSDGQPMQLL